MDYDYLPLNPFIFDIQYESPHIQINRRNNQSPHDLTDRLSKKSELVSSTTSKTMDGKEAVTEDRRRRNTEASARFRSKKKIREKELEETVRDMAAKSNVLECRIKELEFEANWLRSLLMERDQFSVDFL